MGDFYPVYHCLSDTVSPKWNVSSAMIVGAEAFSPGPAGRTLKDITDGTAHTIAVAEWAASRIHWMEPRDFLFNDMSFKIDDPDRVSIRSPHPAVANAMFCDGSVRSLSKDIDPAVLRSLLTIADGQPSTHDKW